MPRSALLTRLSSGVASPPANLLWPSWLPQLLAQVCMSVSAANYELWLGCVLVEMSLFPVSSPRPPCFLVPEGIR